MFFTLIIAFLSLVCLMIIHEFGHFFVAKKFGVKVEEFGIGYPPRLFGKQFGDTLYSINLIPLGAFVRIYGEETGVDDYRSFSNLAVWKRILICLGGFLVFWLASIVIFSVVYMIGVDIPVGDQDIAGVNTTTVRIVAVQKNSPADMAGLQIGDELIGVYSVKSSKAGVPLSAEQFDRVNKVADFQKFIQDSKGKSVALQVKRNGNTMNVNIIPRVDYPADQGPTGIALERMANIIQKSPWYQAIFYGVIYTGKITWQAMGGIYHAISSFFLGKGVPQEAQFAGPIGITIFLSQAASLGAGFFLYFIGSLSVVLALFNILPISALDGGKLLFLIIEGISKKPVSVRIEQTLTIIFFILLITASIFVPIKFDVPRAIEFWKASL